MFGRLWAWFVKLTSVYRYFFGVSAEQQPLLQPVIKVQPTQPELALVPQVDSNKPDINDPFLQLPKDIRKWFAERYLSVSHLLNLIVATKSFLPAYPFLAKQPDYPLRKLLSHSALGEWEAAEAIWSTQSSLLSSFLLTCRSTIFHPNRIYKDDQTFIDIPATQNPGRYKYFNHTVWQIALMNEEFEEAERLGKLMSEEEKRKQFMEVFPTGEMVKYNWDFSKAKELLPAVLNASIHDETINENNLDMMNDETRAALNALYDYVKPALEHKTGLVFDANFYLEALQQYESKFDEFKNWHQRSFWCVRVEEHLAALLGTGYLRLHAQGIGNNLTRAGCLQADQSSYFPFRRGLQSIPGVHFFVGYYGFGRCPARPPMLPGPKVFKFYVRQKQASGQAYAAIFGSPAVPGPTY